MSGKKDSVVSAAEAGDQLAEMRAMRLVVARRIEEETNGTALAALVRRQMDLGNEIAELESKVQAVSGDKAVTDSNVVNAETKFRPEAI